MTMSDQAITIAWIEKLRSNPPQAFGQPDTLLAGEAVAFCALGHLDNMARRPEWLTVYESNHIIGLNDDRRMTLPEIAEHIRERAIHYGIIKVGEVADPVTRKEVACV